MKMQNDAIKRVEDMQRRARETVGITEESHEDKNRGADHKTTIKDSPKRVKMPDDYLDELKEYAENVNRTTSSESSTNQDNINTKRNADKPSVKNSTDGLKNVLGDLKIDEDKALLLSLVLLLSEEKADETLILALLYMLS